MSEKAVIMPEQIIWSADTTWENIKAVIENEALPKGTVIKLDRLFFETHNKDTITYCQDRGYPVFADAKIIEIPDKTLGIAGVYLDYKPWMLNVMAGCCSTGYTTKKEPEKIQDNPKSKDALERFANACAEVGTKSCAVTVLTSKTEDLCLEEYSALPIDQVLFYVELMCDACLTDIVCSPLEATSIRKEARYNGLSINTPGVRLPGSNADDQARILTPVKALLGGSNRLVIGRDLIRGDENLSLVERVKINYARIIENIKAGCVE